MADKQANPPPRSSLALQFDVMTLAIFVILLGVATMSVLEIGPAEALDRVGCGVHDAIDGLRANPQPCH